MLFKLISNENTKIYRRLRTWILLAIVVVATLLVAIAMNAFQKDDPNWKQTAIQDNQAAQQQLNDSSTHMPAVARQQMEQSIQLNNYYIQNNIDPFHETGWKFAATAEQGLPALLIAFIVVISGDIVASEFSRGTIKMLLTQTATRSQILLSKYIAAIGYAIFMMLALLVFSIIIGGLFFGFGGAGESTFYLDPQGNAHAMSSGLFLLMDYAFLLIEVIITVTIAFMISAIFRSSVLAIIIAILAYLVGNTLVGALSGFSWVKYILFANTDLSQYVVGGPRIAGMTLGFSITTLVVYFVVMLALSWLIFSKRDVAYS